MYVERQWTKGFWEINSQSSGQDFFFWITRLHDYVHKTRKIVHTESAEPRLFLNLSFSSSRLLQEPLSTFLALGFPTEILEEFLIFTHTFYIFRLIFFSRLVNLLKLLISLRNTALHDASCLSKIFSHHRTNHLNNLRQALACVCLSTTLDTGKCSVSLSLKSTR